MQRDGSAADGTQEDDWWRAEWAYWKWLGGLTCLIAVALWFQVWRSGVLPLIPTGVGMFGVLVAHALGKFASLQVSRPQLARAFVRDFRENVQAVVRNILNIRFFMRRA